MQPPSRETLRVKADGQIFNGNTRIKVLEKRGFDINTLPIEIIPLPPNRLGFDFGRNDIDLPWEATNRVDALRSAAGLA